MNRELGVWTNTDSALVLIDYQRDQFESLRSETPVDLIELNTRWLARAAKAFDVPIVLSTIGVESGTNDPTVPAIAAELEGVESIDRSSTNSFESDAFREAVAATGRRRLIFGALQTEVCLAFPFELSLAHLLAVPLPRIPPFNSIRVVCPAQEVDTFDRLPIVGSPALLQSEVDDEDHTSL